MSLMHILAIILLLTFHCIFYQATDEDGETQGGGKVFYSIQEGNTEDEAFFMEPVSGELIIQRPLTHMDTPSATYALTIRATDAGNYDQFYLLGTHYEHTITNIHTFIHLYSHL